MIISHSYIENNYKESAIIRLGNKTGSTLDEFTKNYFWAKTVPVTEPGELLTTCSDTRKSGRYLVIYTREPELSVGEIYIYAP